MTAEVRSNNQLPNRTPASGKIVYTVNTEKQVIRDPAGNVVFQGPLSVKLVAGQTAIDLPASDDPTLQPSGFTFTATEQLEHVAKSAYRSVEFQTVEGQVRYLADYADGDEIALDPSYGANLNGVIASIDAIRDGSDPAIAGLADRRPSWAQNSGGVPIVGAADPATGWFNLRADFLSRWRRGVARAKLGGRVDLTVFGPSTQAASSQDPASTYSAAARLEAYLLQLLGLTRGGTGIVPIWVEYNQPGDGAWSPARDPRWSFSRNAAQGFVNFADPENSTTPKPIGIYGYQGIDLRDTSAQNNRATFSIGFDTTSTDKAWIYALETGTRTFVVEFDGGTPGAYKDVAASSADATNPAGNVPVAAGFLHDGGGGGGQRFASWTPATGVDALRFIGNGGTGNLRLLAAEVRRVTGLSVHNLSLSGRALYNLFQNNNTVSGIGGPPLLVRMARSDLLVIAHDLNDYAGNVPLTDYYNQLSALIDAQRSYGGPTATGGDAIIVLNAQPNYAVDPWKPAGKAAPLTNYYAAAYRVAMEKGVPLLDHAVRWVDFAHATDVFIDDAVHPNIYGSDDQARVLAATLASA